MCSGGHTNLMPVLASAHSKGNYCGPTASLPRLSFHLNDVQFLLACFCVVILKSDLFKKTLRTPQLPWAIVRSAGNRYACKRIFFVTVQVSHTIGQVSTWTSPGSLDSYPGGPAGRWGVPTSTSSSTARTYQSAANSGSAYRPRPTGCPLTDNSTTAPYRGNSYPRDPEHLGNHGGHPTVAPVLRTTPRYPCSVSACHPSRQAKSIHGVLIGLPSGQPWLVRSSPPSPRARKWSNPGHLPTTAAPIGTPPALWLPPLPGATPPCQSLSDGSPQQATQHIRITPPHPRRVRITDDPWSSALVPRRIMPLKPGAGITAQRGDCCLCQLHTICCLSAYCMCCLLLHGNS